MQATLSFSVSIQIAHHCSSKKKHIGRGGRRNLNYLSRARSCTGHSSIPRPFGLNIFIKAAAINCRAESNFVFSHWASELSNTVLVRTPPKLLSSTSGCACFSFSFFSFSIAFVSFNVFPLHRNARPHSQETADTPRRVSFGEGPPQPTFNNQRFRMHKKRSRCLININYAGEPMKCKATARSC